MQLAAWQQNHQAANEAGGFGGDAPATDALHPTENDVRQELGTMIREVLHDPQRHGNLQHKLMAVTMLCMLPGYEMRAKDFLQPSFEEFQSRVSSHDGLSEGLHDA